MKHHFVVATLFSAVAVLPLAVGATDVLNSDDTAYTLTLTSDEGTKTLEIAPDSQNIGVCDGCEISLPDGEKLSAAPDDTIVIADGVMLVGN